SVFNKLLKGDFDFVDAIVLPRSNDAQQRLYYYLCELKRQKAAFRLPPVFLVDILHSERDSTLRHNQRKVTEFIAFMEAQSGRPLDDSALAQAIADYNSARDQLQRFNALRARRDMDLPSALSHAVYAAAQSLPVG